MKEIIEIAGQRTELRAVRCTRFLAAELHDTELLRDRCESEAKLLTKTILASVLTLNVIVAAIVQLRKTFVHL